MNYLSKELQLKVLELSYKHNLSHLSSTIPAANILDYIYKIKKPKDKIVLSNGHAGVALYCALEKYENKNAESLYLKNGIHPNRNLEDGISCSTGSLGLGLPIAVGMALGGKSTVHCIISDGEATEGSIWESLRFIDDESISNIEVYVQANGYGAYSSIDVVKLERRLKAFLPRIILCETDTMFTPCKSGLDYHYKKLNVDEYNTLKDIINEGKIQTTITRLNREG